MEYVQYVDSSMQEYALLPQLEDYELLEINCLICVVDNNHVTTISISTI